MRALLLCIALTLLSATASPGSEVLILQSQRSAAYGETIKGFHRAFKGSSRIVVLSDYAEVDVARLVREERARLVVAMGDRGVTAARTVREVPVLGILSFLPQWEGGNMGGIGMIAPPEQYFKLFAALGVKRIGVLCDPKKSGRYLKRAQQNAREAGFTLVVEQVSSPREVQGKLERLQWSVDALWMLPDPTVVTAVNIEAFFLFSVTHNVPIVTFSSLYLNYGAAAAVEVDYNGLGVQAGEIAASLAEEDTRSVPTVDPRKSVVHVNESVLHKLGRRAPTSLR